MARHLFGLIILAISAIALVAIIHPFTRPVGVAGRTLVPAAGRSARATVVGSSRGTLPTHDIEQRLVADVSGFNGTYGVAVIDLPSGSIYGVNGANTFRAASVNKMPILLTLLQRAASGQIDLDQKLTLTEGDIQHYGTGTIQDPEAPRTYSLRQLATLMIEVSDNTAAYVLERLLGQAAVQQNVRRWALTQTSMADNTTSPANAASLMADLYADSLLPPPITDEALALLQQTLFPDRLAGRLPAGVRVAHKVGTEIGVYNDAGIVLISGRPYAIAVLTEDADPNEADDVYARITKDVYDFESALPRIR